METPPPVYQPDPSYSPPRRKRSPVLLILGIIFGVIVVCCGSVFLMIRPLLSKVMPAVSCAFNVQIAQKAIDNYAERTGKFPNAATWQDDIAQDFNAEAQRVAPNGKVPLNIKMWSNTDNWICSSDEPQTGIAFNDDLSGKKYSDVADPTNTVVIFEVPQTGHNLHQQWERRPDGYVKASDGSKRPWLEVTVGGNMK